jgi:hypothetical protein
VTRAWSWHAVHIITQTNRDDRAVAIVEDLRDPWYILAYSKVEYLLDLQQPAAVLAGAVLDHLDANGRPQAVLAEYIAATVAGSSLVASHLIDASRPSDLTVHLSAIFAYAAVIRPGAYYRCVAVTVTRPMEAPR